MFLEIFKVDCALNAPFSSMPARAIIPRKRGTSEKSGRLKIRNRLIKK
jgi:hypothetical protein